jgi:hypothetical protein
MEVPTDIKETPCCRDGICGIAPGFSPRRPVNRCEVNKSDNRDDSLVAQVVWRLLTDKVTLSYANILVELRLVRSLA